MIENFSIPFNREEYTTVELKQLINMFQDSNFMQCCLEELERRENISKECYNMIKEGNCYFHTYDNDFYLSFITINKIENNEIIYSSIYINKPNSTVTYYIFSVDGEEYYMCDFMVMDDIGGYVWYTNNLP